ncbi:MAG: hypothetical protein IJT46_01045 [Bacteroidaceae bacterium]|nr:hypothetical protein [Bacteroidaceae bacterium]
MLARTKKIQLTVEELDTLLTGRTDNGKVDTIPEMVDAFEEGTSPVDMEPMTNIEIENIINNSLDF